MTISPGRFKRHFPTLLDSFDDEEAAHLLEHLERVEIAAGEALYRIDEPADYLVLVWEGELIIAIGDRDDPIPIGRVTPGRFLGVASVIDPGPAVATVTASRPGVLLRLDHDALERLRRRHPDTGGRLLQVLSLALVQWLRSFETFVATRTRPDNVSDYVQLARQLLGIQQA